MKRAEVAGPLIDSVGFDLIMLYTPFHRTSRNPSGTDRIPANPLSTESGMTRFTLSRTRRPPNVVGARIPPARDGCGVEPSQRWKFRRNERISRVNSMKEPIRTPSSESHPPTTARAATLSRIPVDESVELETPDGRVTISGLNRQFTNQDSAERNPKPIR